MKKHQTQIVEIDIEDVIGADWNYKTDGTKEEIEQLKRSIEKHGSCGVFAVRELKDKFEVMDGNHRLAAIREMGWKKVPCENFGKIKKAFAIIIARSRNYNWFSDDVFKLQKLYNEEVFKEFNVDELLNFMPDSKGFMESLASIGELPWDRAKESEANTAPSIPDGFVELKIKIPNETMEVWGKLKDRYNKALGEIQPDYRVLEFALIEAMNVPEESLQKPDEVKYEV